MKTNAVGVSGSWLSVIDIAQRKVVGEKPASHRTA